VLGSALALAALCSAVVLEGIMHLSSGGDGLEGRLARAVLVAVASAGLGASLTVIAVYLHLRRMEEIVAAAEAGKGEAPGGEAGGRVEGPPAARGFGDAVGECLDLLYLETGDEFVRFLRHAAAWVDEEQSREGRRAALTGFLILYNFYVDRYGGEPWFRDVNACVAEAMGRAVEDRAGGGGHGG